MKQSWCLDYDSIDDCASVAYASNYDGLIRFGLQYLS